MWRRRPRAAARAGVGCELTGVDREKAGLANARRIARQAGLDTPLASSRPTPSLPLPFADGAFDAILCLDALNHLPGRAGVFADWARLLVPGGRLLVTDPVTITGLVASDELAIRSSIGYFDFAPPGEDERLLQAAGLKLIAVEDLTESVAAVARARCTVRAERAQVLRHWRATRGSSAASASSTLPRRSRASGASRASPTSRGSRAERF